MGWQDLSISSDFFGGYPGRQGFDTNHCNGSCCTSRCNECSGGRSGAGEAGDSKCGKTAAVLHKLIDL